MSTSLYRQLAALGTALALGTGLGLLYDLLRPPRRQGGGLLASLLDLLFAFCAGAAVFLRAMAAPEGRLGLWERAREAVTQALALAPDDQRLRRNRELMEK